MRIASVILLCCFLFSGCKTENQLLDKAMELRTAVLGANQCSFTAVITADYSDAIYTFQIDCEEDIKRNVMHFIVTDPDSISGITGQISQETAVLTFDDRVLVFSKTSAIFFPSQSRWGIPAFFFALRSAERSRR